MEKLKQFLGQQSKMDCFWKKKKSVYIFPDFFKIAKVIPIFKSESQVPWNNYRPISLLSNISKLIEKLMQKQVYSFLEQQNCFYNAQFGFHLSLSTNNALMSITDQNNFCAGVFVDLKKAFDTVDHVPTKSNLHNDWFLHWGKI